MPRRASSGISPLHLLLSLLALLLVAGIFLLFLKGDNKEFDAPTLDLANEVDRLNSLAGNQYRIEGKLIDRNLSDSIEIATLQVGQDHDPHFLSIKIPPETKVENLNLQTSYQFLIKFDQTGLAIAQAVQAR